MKNMKKIIKKCQGFTLVELIVSLLIISILLGAVSSIYFISMKVYTRAENISYKEGSITNVETNFQNLLAVTTEIELSVDPSLITGEFYGIGFDNGICQEWTSSIIYESGAPKLDAGGHIQYATTVNTISQLSDIKVQAVPKAITIPPDTVYTLNYELIPINAMSVLRGGVVMNNIKQSKANVPVFDLTHDPPIYLNIASEKHFLILY